MPTQYGIPARSASNCFLSKSKRGDAEPEQKRVISGWPFFISANNTMAKKWAQKAFSNAHGQLHKQLGVPQDETIPKTKLHAAARGMYGNLAKKRALPVVNIQK